MKKILLSLGVSLFLCGSLFAQAPPAAAQKPAEPAPKAAAAAPAKTETVAVLQTKLGKIVIRFFPEKAPNHVKNFTNLCKSGFYNGTKFHRVIPNFMIQGGDPNTKSGDPSTWGTGGFTDKDGKEITLKAEFNDIHHARGIVSMARAQDPNSASSQFFICVADAGYLDRQYTVFGEVVSGMEVVDKIVSAPKDPSNDRPKEPVSIDKALIEKRPVQAPETPAKPDVPAKTETPAKADTPAK
jgi:peptidyl-prolyl cis-trans isomerase B (cyclophilin B)